MQSGNGGLDSKSMKPLLPYPLIYLILFVNDNRIIDLSNFQKEVSSCQELHQIARDSEAQLEKLDKSWRLAAERQLNDLRSSYEKRVGHQLQILNTLSYKSIFFHAS